MNELATKILRSYINLWHDAGDSQTRSYSMHFFFRDLQDSKIICLMALPLWFVSHIHFYLIIKSICYKTNPVTAAECVIEYHIKTLKIK